MCGHALKLFPRPISGVYYWHSGHDRDCSWHFARMAVLLFLWPPRKGQVVVVDELLDTI